MTTIESALENVMSLDYDSREMLLEILQKRQIEARREVIAKNAKKSLKAYNENKTDALSANDAIDYLNNL